MRITLAALISCSCRGSVAGSACGEREGKALLVLTTNNTKRKSLDEFSNYL